MAVATPKKAKPEVKRRRRIVETFKTASKKGETKVSGFPRTGNKKLTDPQRRVARRRQERREIWTRR